MSQQIGRGIIGRGRKEGREREEEREEGYGMRITNAINVTDTTYKYCPYYTKNLSDVNCN
jgi:hypothetical protein